MKVWLDDQWDDPEMPVRHPPEGFTPSKSVLEVARWIREGRVSFISFDHDLGLPFDGGTLAKCIEKWAAEGKIHPIKWEIHSANPVGRDRIGRAMVSAERFWMKPVCAYCSVLLAEKGDIYCAGCRQGVNSESALGDVPEPSEEYVDENGDKPSEYWDAEYWTQEDDLSPLPSELEEDLPRYCPFCDRTVPSIYGERIPHDRLTKEDRSESCPGSQFKV